MSDVPVSPELALVDAELRDHALAALPERQPFEFLDFPDTPRRHPDLDAFGFLADYDEDDSLDRKATPLPLAAAAYAAEAVLHFVAVAIPVVAGLALLVALLASVR